MQPKHTGIPTTYRAILFRSRLEARWAAFFDLLRWKWDYEPIDLPGWIPDFVLHGVNEKVLVEIKPIWNFDQEVADKCVGAAAEAKMKNEVLILGASPLLDGGNSHGDFSHENDAAVGWLSQANTGPEPWFAPARFARDPKTLEVDFAHDGGDWGGRMFGVSDADRLFIDKRSTARRVLENYWSTAGNTVQWRRRK